MVKEKLECKECGKKFYHERNLYAHHWFIHGFPTKCHFENCDYETKGPLYKFKLHDKNKHEEITSYLCDHCNKIFKSKRIFNAHKRKHLRTFKRKHYELIQKSRFCLS